MGAVCVNKTFGFVMFVWVSLTERWFIVAPQECCVKIECESGERNHLSVQRLDSKIIIMVVPDTRTSTKRDKSAFILMYRDVTLAHVIHLVQIESHLTELKESFLFVCFSWFDTGCEDRKIERTLLPVGEISADATVPPNVKSRE